MTNSQPDKQKRVLITGGASGLGRALALRWAKAGSQVCIVDKHDERGAEALAEVNACGGEGLYLHCDITNEAQINDVKEVLLAKWGGVDIVINNAGVATAGELESETIEQWQWILNINVLGMVRMTQAFTPVFKLQGHGYFINIASQAALTPVPMMASYNASKAAVVSFSETMFYELADYNIGVSVLCPSFFKTHLGESLRSSNEGMRSVMNKLFERASIDAEGIADITYQAVGQKQFMIQTHKEAIKAFWLKRFMPQAWYLNLILKKTFKLRQQGG